MHRSAGSAIPTVPSTDHVARLRLTALVILVASVLVTGALGQGLTTRARSIEALDAAVLVRLNAIRAEHGLVPLKPDVSLTDAATAHSSQMLADGYFAHESADGTPFWKRLVRYTTQSTNGRWSVGENLLWSSPDVGANRALALWMASPEHERNILTARWRDVGIAAMHADAAPGTYGGRPVTVITTDFGVRR
jgi:uncharacterized protein YkwD